MAGIDSVDACVSEMEISALGTGCSGQEEVRSSREARYDLLFELPELLWSQGLFLFSIACRICGRERACLDRSDGDL
jgi:hypothetical protein